MVSKENIDSDLCERKWVIYLYVVMFACLSSFMFLVETRLLNQLTICFFCVFYSILIFHGCNTLLASQQKQAEKEKHQ